MVETEAEADEAERGGTVVSNGEGGIFTVGRHHLLVLRIFYFLSIIYLPYFLTLPGLSQDGFSPPSLLLLNTDIFSDQIHELLSACRL